MKRIFLLLALISSYALHANIEEAVEQLDVEAVETYLKENKLSDYQAINLARLVSSRIKYNERFLKHREGALWGCAVGILGGMAYVFSREPFVNQGPIVMSGIGASTVLGYLTKWFFAKRFNVKHANEILKLLTKNLSAEVIATLPHFTTETDYFINMGPFWIPL